MTPLIRPRMPFCAARRKALEGAEKDFENAAGVARSKPGEKAAADQLDRAGNRLKKERASESRLFAIDAGLDPGILRKRHKDRARFAVAGGLLTTVVSHDRERNAVSGRISCLSVENIFVPLEFKKALGAIPERRHPRQKTAAEPRYAVTLAYGSRLEPWIVSVRLLNDK